MRNVALADDVNRVAMARVTRRRFWWTLLVLVVIVAVGWCTFRVWAARRVDPKLLLDQAKSDWSSGRLDQAEMALARLARMRDAPLPERLLRAQVARERGRIDQALAALGDVPDSRPEAALIWRTRGMLELERDRAGPAEDALLHALSLNPNLAETRRDLVSLYTIESRVSDLRAQFLALGATGALSFDDLYLWCLGRRPDVGPAEAIAKLERMLQNTPDDPLISLALAEQLRKLGRLAEAEKAVSRLPDSDPAARAARVRLALDRGAIDVAQGLLTESPADHPALWRLRGRLALAQGQSAAAEHYRAALAAEPDDRDTLFGLGLALRLAGKSQAAQPYLDAAGNLHRLEWLIENARASSKRDSPEVMRAIGDACRSVKRLAEARAWYRLGLSREPLDAELQKRLFELEAASTGKTPGRAR
jgi:tetratricopeptide (TPR) repeat protein